MSIYAFDDEEQLENVTESEFASTWTLCKNMNAANLEAIARFREAYFQIQRAQTEKMQDILNSTLEALYKNAFLPRDQSQQLIETESQCLFIDSVSCNKSSFFLYSFSWHLLRLKGWIVKLIICFSLHNMFRL